MNVPLSVTAADGGSCYSPVPSKDKRSSIDPARRTLVGCPRPQIQLKVLSVFHIVLGTVLLLFFLFSLEFTPMDLPYFTHGLFSGIMFIFVGSFGLCAGHNHTQCKLVTLLVKNSVSAVLATSLATLGFITAISAFERHQAVCLQSLTDCQADELNLNASLVVGIFTTVVGTLEAIVAIWESVVCSDVLGCRTKSDHQVYMQRSSTEVSRQNF